MYDKQEPVASKQSQHESIAVEFASQICQFSHDLQNEMLKVIRQTISERRQLEIEETEKKLAYLKSTMQEL
jgi:sensor histidine kinase YesM